MHPMISGPDPRRALLVAVMLLVSVSAHAAPAVLVSRQGPAELQVESRCRVSAPLSTVWAVLTDYDRIDDFVSSIRESRTKERNQSHALVEQVAVGRLLIFSRRLHVLLDVHEEENVGIHFEDKLGRDFLVYKGSWQLVPHGDQIEITYRLTARPNFRVPDLVARGVFRRAASGLMGEVEAEILRRAEASPRAGAPVVETLEPRR